MNQENQPRTWFSAVLLVLTRYCSQQSDILLCSRIQKVPAVLPTGGRTVIPSGRIRQKLSFLTVSLGIKDYYQAFFWVLIDLIVELLGLIIKPFDNQEES